ncbi:MuF-C-terminal domain-containing protein [Cardiobacterium valvarum]|uniref:ATPase involved in DNA repair n=1 Tax=Cardiobacterium valvarum TaxID=194702 RepID=A0A381E9H3_9GAMM|nr:hypothetical protein [Cardiobacterium valvarum]SUX23375.1 ATPase involved in DNA repair [Cardiobacterium valvarum]
MTDFNDPNATAARRLRLLDALHLNPDKRAEDRTIGMATGTPIGLVDDNTRRQYRVNQLDAQMQGLAVLPAAVRKSETFATLAQDDLETLASLEKVTKARQRRANAIAAAIRKANEPGLWREFGSSVWAGLRRFANNIDLQQADAARQRINDAERWTTFDITQRSLRDPDFDINAYLDEQNAYIAKEEENIRRNVAEYEEDLPALQPTRSEQSAREMQEYHNLQGPLESIAYLATHPRVAINMTGDSLGVMAPTLMATIASGGALGAPAAMTTIGVGTLQTEYSTTLAERIDAAVQQQNKSRVDILADRKLMEEIRHAAGVRGSVIGATEAATLGVSGILYRSIRNKIAATAAGMGSEIIGGAGGEAMAQLAVDGRITSWSDVVAEGMLEIVLGAPEVAMHAAFARNQLQAEHNADLENQDATAAAVRDSRTRARAPDVFAQYVHDVVEDSGLDDIYADGNALHQDGLDVALAEALPERAEEIRAAVENGGAVQIPLEDYLLRVAPNEDLTNALRPHIRDADSMSAQELDNNALGELEQDIRNEVTRLAAEDTRAAEIQALEQSIIEQLDAAGQTTTEANRTYATLYSASVDTLSRRMGISPQEYHAQYGIHIVGGQVAIRTQAGEQTLTPAEAARQLAAGAEAAVQGGQQDTAAQGAPAASTAAAQQNGQPLSTAEVLRRWAAGEEKALVDSLRKQVGELGTTAFDARIDALEAQYNSAEADALPLEIHAYARANGYTAQRTGNGIGQFEWVQQNAQASAQNSYQQAARSVATRTAYEARIDELFAGEPANREGITVLDRSDILDLLGFGDTPVRLVESKVVAGQTNHPNITAEVWKKVPEWVENPAMVFDSDTEQGRLTVIAPELVEGQPVRIILSPSRDGLEAAVLINAYDAANEMPLSRWANDRLLRYADTKRAAQINEAFGRRLPNVLKNPDFMPDAQIHGMGRGNKKSSRRTKILTEKELGGYRKRKAAQEAAQQNPAQDSYLQNYRRNNRDVPFNDVPYMMFADDAESIASYGKNLWELPDDVGNRISASATAFREALGKYLRENIDRLRESGYGAGLTDEELVQNLVDEADPGDIVDSAGLWDINEDWLMNGIMEEVLQPNGWNVVDTSDGALAFDPELVRRVDMDEEGNIIDYIPPQATTEEEQAIKAGREQLREAEAALQESEERNAKSRQLREKVEADIRARGQEPGENYWEAFDLDTEKSAYFADRESARAWADEQAGNDPGRFSVYEHAMPREKDTTALQEQVAALQEYAPQTLGQYLQEQATPRGAFSPDTNTITLTPNADLSTFIHELGHYFLETLTRHATELRARNDAGEALTAGQQQIIKDADTILANLGVPGLDSWHSMTLEEKRSHHELAARQFETYILEGKAPSLELQGAFQRFRAWLFRIYKNIRNLNAPLNDDVRQVFDRLLATEEAIELAEQNRSMMQLFTTPEEAGMTPEQFAEYQQQGRDAAQAAQDEMQARALRDTKYIRNLRNKALRRKQQEAQAARQQAEMQARQLVLRQPVYRVWQFLSGTMNPDTTIAGNKRAWTDAVDPAHDDLNTAIAKLGGLNREAVEKEWGLDPQDRIPDIRPGFPVLRRNGGLSVDGMRQALVEQGYLNDRDSLNDFYAIFAAQQRGESQYSKLHQPDPGSGKAGEHAHLHDLPTLRLDHNALLELGYSEAQIKQLGRKVSKTGGVHPDLVAELFQDEDGNALYDSGDAMVQALLAAKRPRDAINDVADDIMLQQFGELATPQAVALAADMAVHNNIRLRMIAGEYNILAQAVGNKTLLNRAARQLAQETIAAKRLRDIRPAQYTRMEARAAKAAALAQKKGDIATAAAEKRNQLLQAHLARAAYEAQEEAATHLRYLKRMGRLNPKHIDIKQREQIEAILERYNLRDQSNKAIDRSQTLAQWVEEQRKQGIEVNIDPKVLDEAKRTPWQHLSLTDLRGLRDSIKQIEHQGRLKNELLLNRKNRELDAVITALVDGLKQHATRSGIENRTSTTTGGRALAKFRRFFFAHRKVAMIARQMDGDRDGGAWWENLIRPANERADWQTMENARATEALAHILAPLMAQKGLNRKRSYTIGGRQRSFTLLDIFGMGLNYGNDSNAQRLLGGENWNAAEFEQLLSQLNADQLNALQGVWDLFETYKPQIADITRRVLGIEPEWIEARPFTITSADGQTVSLRGGYYPVMYDPRASAVSAEQEMRDMESGAYSAAVINRGFLKSRVKEVHDRPLLYDMTGIYRGLNNVIHYITWYEFQLDTNRLLNSKRVSDAIRNHYGDDVYRQFKSWARDTAVGDLQIESEGVALVNAVRRNAGVAGLGFNIISALKQPLGLLQSVARVGGRHILPQLGRWMIHAPQMVREAKAQSAFMQNRARTRFRELNELAAGLRQQNKLQTFLARHSYTLIMFVQMQVDTITWHAQQQKSLEAGATEAEAIQHADQAVIDSQGSGMLKDLSAAERGQVMKLFTIYYGFMNTIMNLSYNTLTSTRQGKIEKAVNLTVLLAIAPILEAALTDLLKPGDSDRWDEENMAKTMAAAMMNNLLGQFIILREMNLSGYGYTGPVGLRAIADAYKLHDEIQQGEWDSGLRRAVIGIGGSVFGLPAAQINRTLDGLQALDDGTTDNPLAVALGKPQQ